jgi:hypothetical protein
MDHADVSHRLGPGQGVQGLDWVWLGIALLIDVGADAGGAYGNRRRIFGRRR